MTTARKRHACSWCAEPIEPGETYHREVVWGEGGPETWKAHPECLRASPTIPDDARQALADGEYWPLFHMRRGVWVEDP